ncbi:type II toxin-antitoxin system death-on-curing family toxin [Nocardia sp. NPDC051030]|uniref:type II toxin-antitoxin system death-on-curing family toxin n=1 Tax=Nocardia sp. NPDC051030 TaxID=3155162 RepID=UPI003435C6C5
MRKYVSLEDVLKIANLVTGDGPAMVRDMGLVQAAVARPLTVVFGLDPYPDVFSKAAALLHSLSWNHPFIDGNKRTAWMACILLLALHEIRLRVDDDAAEALVIAVATGNMEEVPDIAEALKALQ